MIKNAEGIIVFTHTDRSVDGCRLVIDTIVFYSQTDRLNDRVYVNKRSV